VTNPDAGFDVLLGGSVESGSTESGSAQGWREPPSKLDAWWARRLGTPLRQRLWYWGGPIAVTLLAAFLRLWHLGTPHALVFDETYYVKDAWTLLHLGYEGSWPANADAGFNAGDVNSYTSAGSYVAHPPLGKWMIAIGEWFVGVQNPVGWRISAAVVGILAVVVLMMIARMLFRSTTLAVIAGFLFAIDGHAIVLSRTALLDGFVMIFTLLGFWAILLDRGQSRRRLERWIRGRTDAGRSTDWGPTLWARPWLIVAGLLFGAATAVKWSGLYFIAAFAIYTLIVDAVARRKAGVEFWVTGTVFKQAPATFLLTVPIALATYLAAWTGWFVTMGGYYREWADQPGTAWTGFWAWVPRPVQSFLYYQQSVYNFNINEHTPHSYQANPLTWLFLFRPTAFYYQAIPTGQNGCTSFDGCASYVTSIANPIIWWAATAALFYLVYRLIRYREWRVGLILMGVVAGYLPWLLYVQRTIFQFYAIVFEPCLILGLVFVIGLLLGSRDDPAWRRVGGIRLVAIFLGLAALLSAFFYPVWTGMQIPTWFAQLHYWFPGWR
jgi:dolichyl-phosphate-mannose--protein O-mannosyl transferase